MSSLSDFAKLSYFAEDMLCCPNCGGVAVVAEEHFNDGDTWYRPECNHCNVSWQENYPTIEEAVAAWNKYQRGGIPVSRIDEVRLDILQVLDRFMENDKHLIVPTSDIGHSYYKGRFEATETARRLINAALIDLCSGESEGKDECLE